MKPKPYPQSHSIGCSLLTALAGFATLIVIDAWVLCSVAARAWGVE